VIRQVDLVTAVVLHHMYVMIVAIVMS
jgi:hypothetical protein